MHNQQLMSPASSVGLLWLWLFKTVSSAGTAMHYLSALPTCCWRHSGQWQQRTGEDATACFGMCLLIAVATQNGSDHEWARHVGCKVDIFTTLPLHLATLLGPASTIHLHTWLWHHQSNNRNFHLIWCHQKHAAFQLSDTLSSESWNPLPDGWKPKKMSVHVKSEQDHTNYLHSWVLFINWGLNPILHWIGEASWPAPNPV